MHNLSVKTGLTSFVFYIIYRRIVRACLPNKLIVLLILVYCI